MGQLVFIEIFLEEILGGEWIIVPYNFLSLLSTCGYNQNCHKDAQNIVYLKTEH